MRAAGGDRVGEQRAPRRRRRAASAGGSRRARPSSSSSARAHAARREQARQQRVHAGLLERPGDARRHVAASIAQRRRCACGRSQRAPARRAPARAASACAARCQPSRGARRSAAALRSPHSVSATASPRRPPQQRGDRRRRRARARPRPRPPSRRRARRAQRVVDAAASAPRRAGWRAAAAAEPERVHRQLAARLARLVDGWS